jgi:pimeloyl-ACP methyl ester carboxylesterase
MRLFAEMRFKDNGQWAESVEPEPEGTSVEIVAGHGDVLEPAIGEDLSISTMTEGRHSRDDAKCGVSREGRGKISREKFALYQYHVTAFGDSDCNWGEQLFAAVQFGLSYRSFGWTRRPIGRRVEQFLGLPASCEDDSEFYSAVKQVAVAHDHSRSLEMGSRNAGKVPVSFFYGKSDWMPFRAATLISDKARRHCHRNVPVLLLRHSGHQMFIDNPKGFVEGLRLLVPKAMGVP